MSTALAIASVTAVLKDLLNNGLIDHNVSTALAGDVVVTALPPDRIDTASTSAASQLNVFLYHVSRNSGWANAGLPARDSRGDRISNPPLALDLHYLLMAYGAQELHSEILLGYGMQLLHETPVLSRDAIRRSLAPPTIVPGGSSLPDVLRQLSTADLAEQVETIKITHQPLSIDELSKLWSSFQTKYRPVAAYHVSVVLIESRLSTRRGLPVVAPMAYVRTLQHPRIVKILARRDPADPFIEGMPILAGDELAIDGHALAGDDTAVRIDRDLLVPSTVAADRVTLALPAALQAGLHGVQIVHRTPMGAGDRPHDVVESNAMSFLLRPRIDSIAPSDVNGSGSAPRSGKLTVGVTPPIEASQRVSLLLNEHAPAATTPAAGYSFQLPSRTVPGSPPPPAASSVVFNFSGVKAATYLARIVVDGAESPLRHQAGAYDHPRVTVP